MGQKAFEALLQRIEHSPDREVLQGLASKYPFLTDGVATQEELAGLKTNFADEKNRLTTRFNELTTRLQTAEQVRQQWEDWKERAWDSEKRMPKAEVLLRQQMDELTRENDLLRNQEGEQVTLEQLDSYLQQKAQRGEIVTSDALKGQLGQYVDRNAYASDVQQRLGAAAGMVGQFMAQTMPLFMKHRDEFNEVLDLEKVVEAAQTKYGGNIAMGYEDVVGPRRKEREDQLRQQQIAEAEKRGFEKAQQQRAMSAEGSMPVDMGTPMGHLQERYMRTPQKDGEQMQGPPEGVELGSFGLAKLAAADALSGSGGKE
jgi:hypothetical protein